MQAVDAIFEGGGVKGLAFCSAVETTLQRGYQFRYLAGSSVGAICAALIAAGYTIPELEELLSEDFSKFCDAGWEQKVPLPRIIKIGLSLKNHLGIYKGDALEQWLEKALAAKGVKTFADLMFDPSQGNPRYRYRLSVTVGDVTNKRMALLPEDLPLYGFNIDTFSVARAVRLSAGIPGYFYMQRLGKILTMDGGMLSNYPLWIYFDAPDDSIPTFGYKLVSEKEIQAMNTGLKADVWSAGKAVWETVMTWKENEYLDDATFAASIMINTGNIKTTQFSLGDFDKAFLKQQGRLAAEKFHDTFDYTTWLQMLNNPKTRRERIWSNQLLSNESSLPPSPPPLSS